MGHQRLRLVERTTLGAAYRLSATNGSEAALIALGGVLADRIEATTDPDDTARLAVQLLAVLRELKWTPATSAGHDDDQWRAFHELGGPTIRDEAEPGR
jgi:hypothetical protein